MRSLACFTCILSLALATACAPDAPTAPDVLAPEEANFSRNSKTDEDANFKYDKNNDDWYCVKQYGTGPMFMDNEIGDDPATAEIEEKAPYCEKENYALQQEL